MRFDAIGAVPARDVLVGRTSVERLMLALAVVVTRLPFRSERLYDLDSVNFALGLSEFDPWLHRPHPPGYYLYILSGRLMQRIFPDPNDALVALSVAASVVAVLALYELARAIYGGRAGVFAGVAFVLSPLCWFHGTVALTYIVEVAGAAVVGWLCWRAARGDKNAAVWSGVALGLLIGFRQSAVLFLGPLWLYSITRTPGHLGRSAIAFVASCLAWFVPMIGDAGGAERYFGALENLWLAVPAKKTVAAQSLAAGAALGAARIATIGFIFLLTLGSLPAFALLRLRESDPVSGRKMFTFAWLAPGMLFFSIVYLIFVNSGYLLVITPPLFAWIGHVLDRYTSRSGQREATAALAAAAALNVCVFLWAPLYCSYNSVRAFERDLDQTVRDIRTHYSPEKTLIVAFDAHFFGFRHAGYYLPEFETIAYPAAGFRDGKGILSSAGGRPRPALAAPPSGFEEIVFFPLPPGELYEEHFHRNVTLRIGDSRIERVQAGKTALRQTGADALEELYWELAPGFERPSTDVPSALATEYRCTR